MLVEKLYKEKNLTDGEFKRLIEDSGYNETLFARADERRRENYGTDVYIRGLIEISNYCKNNCYYCGIRRDNANIARYRLTPQEILECCETGYALGFRTFVLQGGEDGYYTDVRICEIVSEIREKYPDCAITLSLGERSRESFKAYFDSGANRYLLRHETASEEHYGKLHPECMSLENRKRCLWDLKEIGYQVGSGFMVGSPYQSIENLIEDLRFLQELKPHMVGIGPYISHRNTRFKDFANGSLELCLKMVAIVRLCLPNALIPATTALGTVHPNGREMGLKVGANVVMPNLSPLASRRLYEIYDNKISADEESAEGVSKLKRQVAATGYQVVTHIGNAIG